MKKALGILLGASALMAFSACDDDTAAPASGVDAGPVNVDSGTSGSPADAGSSPACPAATTGPTEHKDNVNAAETWTAAASPHVISGDITINDTLTIEPCATVLIAPLKQVSVVGTLVANGAVDKPIKIADQEAGKPFARIRGSGGSIELANVSVEGGGDPQNALPYLAGAIEMAGKDNSAPTQGLLKVSSVTVSGSKSNGVLLRDGAGFADGSSALTVKGAALHPISVWARAVGTVPAGTYTGNGKDLILIPATAGNEAVRESTTMHERGVPYLVGHDGSQGTLYVASGKAEVATLTIEAGVTLKFKKGGILDIEPSTGENPATGALVAKGSANEKIVFTSAEATPAAGDWKGIWFGQKPSATNAIDHARVEFAGGASTSGSDSCIYSGQPNNDAAIRILGLPAGSFVTSSEIANSASHGIDRGFRSDTKFDFAATNTFTAIARCKQTLPKDSNGSCPATVPCEP